MAWLLSVQVYGREICTIALPKRDNAVSSSCLSEWSSSYSAGCDVQTSDLVHVSTEFKSSVSAWCMCAVLNNKNIVGQDVKEIRFSFSVCIVNFIFCLSSPLSSSCSRELPLRAFVCQKHWRRVSCGLLLCQWLWLRVRSCRWSLREVSSLFASDWESRDTKARYGMEDQCFSSPRPPSSSSWIVLVIPKPSSFPFSNPFFLSHSPSSAPSAFSSNSENFSPQL